MKLQPAPPWQPPEKLQIDDETPHTLTFAGDVLATVPGAYAAIGKVMTSFATADRAIEHLAIQVTPGGWPLVRELMKGWRGQRALLKPVAECLDMAGNRETAKSIRACLGPINAAYDVRDHLAHGLWFHASQHPGCVIRTSLTSMTRFQAEMVDDLVPLDVADKLPNHLKEAEIWTASHFQRAVELAHAVNVTLSGIAQCIGQDSEEARAINLLLQKEVLLSEWNPHSDSPDPHAATHTD